MNEKEGPLNPTYKDKPLNFVQKMKRRKGSFNNYVDQIFPNFDPPSPSSGQKWTFHVL